MDAMESYPLETSRLFHSYPIELQESVDTIATLPEALEILRTIGLIAIQIGSAQGSKALWDWRERTIQIHPDLLQDTKANQVAYLVFELFNALQTPQLKKVLQEAIHVEQFVASIEKLEYASSLSTQKAVLKLLGDEAESDFKYICPDFSLHYALNQVSGHSEQIARSYFPNASYRGTLCHPLWELDATAREVLYCLLYSKVTGNPVKVNGSLRAFGFEEILRTLQRHAGASDSYQKALECANFLFP